jgi:phosphoribosylformylglycinamidine synthase
MKNYYFYLQTGPGTGISFSITAESELKPQEIEKLKEYLARPSEMKSLTNVPFWRENELPQIVGPNMRHRTPEASKMLAALKNGGLGKIQEIEEFLISVDGNIIPNKMTERVYQDVPMVFIPKPNTSADIIIPFIEKGNAAIERANKEYGIGLTPFDIKEVVIPIFQKDNRNPTLSELFIIAVVNSEHARHHGTNAIGIINGERMPNSLFDLIKKPYKKFPRNSTIAFSDNSSAKNAFFVKMSTREGVREVLVTFSAETHNHPSAIEPYQGSQTGTGGLQRDGVATGRNSYILHLNAGLAFGNLDLANGYHIPGEGKILLPRPDELATPLEIALMASQGIADNANEIGFKTSGGYTRSFGATDPFRRYWEFRKPQVFASCAGFMYEEHKRKLHLEKGMQVYMVGGEAYLVGKGGSQASSVMQGENSKQLDFASVQRGNAFVQRKVVQLYRNCMALGFENPIASTSDQGAGGCGNVLIESVSPLGAKLDIAKIKLGDASMSISDILTAEYQERTVIITRLGMNEVFEKMCADENLNCECLGEITGDGRIIFFDSRTNTAPVDLALKDILGDVPKITIKDERFEGVWPNEIVLPKDLSIKKVLTEVLKRIEVGSKDWVTHIQDQTVGGKACRGQYSGPTQIPVNDCAITLISAFENKGVASSIGEQPVMMIRDPKAGTRMSIMEALLNIINAKISLEKLSAQGNEMVALKLKNGYALTYEMLEAASEMLIALGFPFDGGKDSTSMAVKREEGVVISPPSLVVSIYTPISDVFKTLPVNFIYPGKSSIIAINLSGSCNKFRLGASPFLTVFDQTWNDETPDVDDFSALKKAWEVVQSLIVSELITACHDTVGDGLLVSLLEMALAGGCGVDVKIPTHNVVANKGVNPSYAKAFAQEGWIIVECLKSDEKKVIDRLEKSQIFFEKLGETTIMRRLCAKFTKSGEKLTMMWNDMVHSYYKTSSKMKSLRIKRHGGDETLAFKELQVLSNYSEPYVSCDFGKLNNYPKLPKDNANAIVLRAEGTNGHEEMGFGAEMGGFKVEHATMKQLRERETTLKKHQFLLLSGGFSYGDTFRSGVAWAKEFKNNSILSDELDDFITRPDTSILGVCNGAQVGMELKILYPSLIPEAYPMLVKNQSGLYEHHLNYVRVNRNDTIFLKNMEGWVLPIFSAHAEGRFNFPDEKFLSIVREKNLNPLVFTNWKGEPTMDYPMNPNGSTLSTAALSSVHGRFMFMMPHFERILLKANLPYMPKAWDGKLDTFTPWIMMMRNVYEWCLENQRK